MTTEQRIVLEALHVGAYLEWTHGPDHNPNIHSIVFQGMKPDGISDSTEGLTLEMVSDLLNDNLIEIDESEYDLDEDGMVCRRYIVITKAGHRYTNALYMAEHKAR